MVEGKYLFKKNWFIMKMERFVSLLITENKPIFVLLWWVNYSAITFYSEGTHIEN